MAKPRVKRYLKSGLLSWRSLSAKQQRAEIRKYGSKEAAQRARRLLPTQKLKPRAKTILVRRYGSVQAATRERRQRSAQRYVQRVTRPPVVYKPPPTVEEPELEEGELPLDYNDILEQLKYDRAFEVYQGAIRIKIAEWRQRLSEILPPDYITALDDKTLYYHGYLQGFVDMYGPPHPMV